MCDVSAVIFTKRLAAQWLPDLGSVDGHQKIPAGCLLYVNVLSALNASISQTWWLDTEPFIPSE